MSSCGIIAILVEVIYCNITVVVVNSLVVVVTSGCCFRGFIVDT